MKTLLLGLIFVSSFARSAQAQEHPPTAPQCQADIAVWYSPEMATEFNNAETARMGSGTPNLTDINNRFLPEISARIHEMGDCMHADSSHRDDYFNAQSLYVGIVHAREHNFLLRHHLIELLKREDAEGQR
jgi:hypothetical protein